MTRQQSSKPDTAALRREMGFLSDVELAAFLRISEATLKNRRTTGRLPPSSKIGRENLTAVKDALAWVARRKRVTA